MNQDADTLQDVLEQMDAHDLTAKESLHHLRIRGSSFAALVATAERYRRAPAVQPSKSFRATSRARLLSLMADGTAVSAQPLPRTSKVCWISDRLGAVLVRAAAVLLLLCAAVGGGVVLANEALPNEPLYSAKLWLEEVRLGVARQEADRANLQLMIAERRAQELATIAHQAAPDQLESAVRRYEWGIQTAIAAVVEAEASPNALIQLEARLAEQQRGLQQAQARIAAAESRQRDALEQALRFVERERQQLRNRAYGSDGSAGAPGDSQQMQRRRQLGVPPSETPTPTPVESLTATTTPAQTRQPEGTAALNRCHWGQIATPAASFMPTVTPVGRQATVTPTNGIRPSATPQCCPVTPTCTPIRERVRTGVPTSIGSPEASPPVISTPAAAGPTEVATPTLGDGQVAPTPLPTQTGENPSQPDDEGSSAGGPGPGDVTPATPKADGRGYSDQASSPSSGSEAIGASNPGSQASDGLSGGQSMPPARGNGR